jgi:hypothetical protein
MRREIPDPDGLFKVIADDCVFRPLRRKAVR